MFLLIEMKIEKVQNRRVRGPILFGVVLTCSCLILAAQTRPRTIIRIDASKPYSSPGPAAYVEGTAVSPSGQVLGVNSRYLTLGGKPWLPVIGEFHFSRYPRAEWEEELLKMKAAGVDIVATYVIWIHHEEIKGKFDWTGQRDLRAFAQLCTKHHMYLVARIGPWDHAEVRNGGLPDWVLKQGPTRENDPVYLASVRAWYGQIGRQLKGLLFKDGGPVLGIQLENEYSKRGPLAGAAHILELKKIAIASGLDVPLYIVTGWDNAAIPPRAVIPVYGGYPAAPWDGSIRKLPPSEVYAFRFQSRVSAGPIPGADMGASGANSQTSHLPFFTAEIGGGNQDTYHRRPVIHADDIAAMFPVMLGSGVNFYGTYMFHGGENPEGKLTTLQESQATGYPNDLPIKSYDFQAPLGEFGRERASLRKLKVFQYFVNDFGSELAPMAVHAPEEVPASPSDFEVPRASVRSRGDSGFIFFNNYVRDYRMPERPGTQFQIALPGGTLEVPRNPVDISSGAYFIWPFNLDAAGVKIRYSTAQLFTRIEAGDATTYYFEALPGIPVEFAIAAESVHSISTSSGAKENAGGVIYINDIQPGIESSIDLVSSGGHRLRIVVLTAREAEDAWRVRMVGEDHLLITAQDFFADSTFHPERIGLRARSNPDFEFTVTPPPGTSIEASLPLVRNESTLHAVTYTAKAEGKDMVSVCRQVRQAGVAPPVKIGPAIGRRNGVAEAPPASMLPEAAEWAIVIPPGAMQGLSNLYLQIRYQGDLARLYSGNRLLTDNFYNGRPWTIGLRRFLAWNREGGDKFLLSILPLRKDAPVYLQLPNPIQFPENGQAVRLDQVRLIPEYQLILGASKHQNEPGKRVRLRRSIP
jgi:beta-galactosidase